MKTLFLTGGNSGIGYHLIEQWLSDGNRAAVLDLRHDRLDALQARYPDALLIAIGDVSDEADVTLAVERALGAFGRIDFAVHNACLCLFKDVQEHSLEEYGRVMDVNFKGAVNLTKAVLPAMKRQGNGRICFASSGVGVTGYGSISAYASSKGAIESFAKCLRIEAKGSGVTAHILHPPLTDTESSAPLRVPREFKASAEKVGRGFAKRLLQNRFVIAPSAMDAFSVRMSYLFPLGMGNLLAKMTARAANTNPEQGVQESVV